MSISENIKFVGKKRAAEARQRRLAIINTPFRAGTRPRAKTVRRYRKQFLMGLAVFRKEAIVNGMAAQPTKVRPSFPARKVPHPNAEAREISAPFYIVDRS